MVADSGLMESVSSPEAPSSHFHSLSPHRCVADFLCKLPLPRAPERQGALLSFSPVSPNSLGWEFCPPSPQMWPNMAAQTQLALFFLDNFLSSSQIQKVGRSSAENSLGKVSSPTYFSPRLFLNLETKNLMSLFSASFMAGVTIYSCFLGALQVLV